MNYKVIDKEHSRQTGTKFYINFLYVLSKVLNSRDDYKMGYLWQSENLICYDSINPIQYVFHEDTETCTPVYTRHCEDYEVFYRNAVNDLEKANDENGNLMMPVSVRLNHAIADGFLVANVYRLLEKEMTAFCNEMPET